MWVGRFLADVDPIRKQRPDSDGCKALVEKFEKEWQEQYDQPVERPLPKPAAASAAAPASQDEVEVAADAADGPGAKRRKFDKRSSVWDAFEDIGNGMMCFCSLPSLPHCVLQELQSVLCAELMVQGTPRMRSPTPRSRTATTPPTCGTTWPVVMTSTGRPT
jgi:hypothetical protein